MTSSSPNASAISSSSGRSISWPRLSSSRPRLVANFFAVIRPIRFGFRLALVVAQRRLDEVLRLAVVGADDHVLGDVDQAPGEIARVRGAQRGVGEALAGAVGGDEVLEHRQALHEVGLDRALDDLALRIRHQAAHSGELADLLERSARSGVGHHVDRVELVEVVLHRLGDLVGRPVPEHAELLLAVLLGEQAVVVLGLDLDHLLLVAVEDLLLVRRRDDVVLRDRDPGLGREVEPELLERIQRLCDRGRAVGLDQVEDDRVDLTLLQRVVHEVVLLRIPVIPKRRGDRPLRPGR